MTKRYAWPSVAAFLAAKRLIEVLKQVLGRLQPDREPDQAIANFLRSTDQIIAQHVMPKVEKHSAVLAGIGIACGSPLDTEKGIIHAPSKLQSWRDVPIVKIFHERYQVPAFVDNDANAGAIAEFRFGAGRGCRNMVFLTFGTGMGAGLILDGRIYRGTNTYAGEVGHIRLAPEGPVGCRKAGSVEGFCSGGGIAQIAREEYKRFKGVTCLPPEPTTRDVGEAAEKGDVLALRIFEISGHHLGKALAILLDVLNPERIIMGSIFNRCEKFLRPAMEESLRAEALSYTYDVCQILPSGLGEKIGDYAALSVAYNALRD